MSQSTLSMIPIEQIQESPVALRKVNKESEAFLGLRDSIQQRGILNPVSVRRDGDSLILVDGLHRLTAAKEAGLPEIPCHILDMEESQVHAAQIIANVHKVETKPVDYSKSLFRILTLNHLMTVSTLAKELAKSPAWLNQRLGLLKLNEKVAELVNDDKITLSNAYALAKLPDEEQPDWIEAAMTEPPDIFMPKVKQRQADIAKAKREGREAEKREFQPVARLQKLGDIKTEMEDSKIGQALLSEHNIQAPQDAWNMAIKWVLHLDPNSVEAAKTKEEERKRMRAEEADKRKAEKLKKAAEEATAKAVEAEEAMKKKEG